jgi:hypothetical protein
MLDVLLDPFLLGKHPRLIDTAYEFYLDLSQAITGPVER